MHEDAILAAKWKGKRMTVIDSDAYEQMIKVHNLVADKLQRGDLKWEVAVSSAERS